MTTDATKTPALPVAVLMEQQREPNRWEAARFRVHDVVVDAGGAFGAQVRTLRDDGQRVLRLHPGFEVTLHRDEAEGYHLNLTSGAPTWFVMWRIDDDAPACAAPVLVTLSYNEAARLLDAQERVDAVPLPADVAAWLQAYTDVHYRPEPKQRRRPPSFRPLAERG